MQKLHVFVAGVAGLGAASFLGMAAALAGCTDNLSAAQELNIRSGPSTAYEPVARIPGTACGIRIGACEDGWCRVDYNGQTGFSSAFYLERMSGPRSAPQDGDISQHISRWIGVAEDIFGRLADDQRWEILGTLRVSTDRDRDVIQLDRRDGRFNALRMRVRGNAVDFRRVVVVYGNGRRHTLDLDRVVRRGEETGELAFRGHQGRFVDRIIFVYQSVRRSLPPAEVQVWARRSEPDRGVPRRPARYGPDWLHLGTAEARGPGNRDVIEVGRRAQRFDALGLIAERDDVHINRLRVRYGNGVEHELAVPERLARGERTRPIELRGQHGRNVAEVTLVYERAMRGPRAVVTLWGRGAPRARSGYGPNWSHLGTADARRRGDRDVIEVGRRAQRFDALGLIAERNDVRIHSMLVRYGNGVEHELDVPRRLDRGETTRAVELRGQRGRNVAEVTLIYETVTRGPRATISLWGRHEAR